VADTWVGSLLTRLDLVVLERMPHGVFLRLGGGAAPLWFSRVMAPASPSDSVTVAAAIPFLEHFLSDAGRFWDDVREGRMQSEPFMVADPEGGELGVVATAIGLGPRHFLVLGLAADFAQRRHSLQVAREHMLEHEQYVRRTGELLDPLETVRNTLTQLSTTALTAEQTTLLDGVRRELTGVAEVIAALAPLPKGVRRSRV
jgi:hypothetical protein